MNELLELCLIAFAAGTVDAVMGGGGMLQVPALFALFPGVAPAALFGTNKIASLAGTIGAALQYARSLPPRWSTVGPVLAAAFVFALAGAWAVTHVPAAPLRKALPFVLAALWLYMAFSRLGLAHAPHYPPRREAAVGAAGAAAVGFYDGFFGPAAGAFFKLLFVRLLGFDFLNAAAPAKLANVASNIAAIGVFVLGGNLLWKVALPMAVANFLGGQLGSRIGLRYGNRLMRLAFLALVAVLIFKTFRDEYLAR